MQRKHETFEGPAVSPSLFMDQRAEGREGPAPPGAPQQCPQGGWDQTPRLPTAPDQPAFSWPQGRAAYSGGLFVRLDSKCDVSLCICIFK